MTTFKAQSKMHPAGFFLSIPSPFLTHRIEIQKKCHCGWVHIKKIHMLQTAALWDSDTRTCNQIHENETPGIWQNSLREIF